MSKCRASGKHIYRDNVSALLAVARYQRIDDPNRATLPVRSYKCPKCPGWHTTSKPLRT